MITVKIDVTKLKKEYLFKGAKGTYLDLVLMESKDSQYGDSHYVVQGTTKEVREAMKAKGERMPIIGNARDRGAFIPQGSGGPSAKHSAPADASPIGADDVIW